MPNPGYENEPNYIKSTEEDLNGFLKTVDLSKKDAMKPQPPKPGELIICRHCGQPMYPEEFAKKGTYEFKYEWSQHIHWKCRNILSDIADRATPGLLSERRQNDY